VRFLLSRDPNSRGEMADSTLPRCSTEVDLDERDQTAKRCSSTLCGEDVTPPQFPAFPAFMEKLSDSPSCTLEPRHSPLLWVLGWSFFGPLHALLSRSSAFVRWERRHKWMVPRESWRQLKSGAGPTLRNNLLPAIGFIELANAGDFPANVWNEAPLPQHAVILMALGGTLALSMLPFVIRDAVLSFRNLHCLKNERQILKKKRSDGAGGLTAPDSVDCLLHVNFREQGTEWVDRVGMDIIMGFGAFIVGIGTYMAIAGENPHIHLASDLLTGYIGNSPCAMYGLLNLVWSVFIWIRANRHTSEPQLIQEPNIKDLLELRAKEFKAHSLLSGATGLVAGAASLLTYTYWQAYVVLAVCLVSSVVLNFFWRHRLGYDRPLVEVGRDVVFFSEDITYALKYTTSWRARLERKMDEGSDSDPLQVLHPMLGSLSDIMTFLRRHHLFEEFCLEICSQSDDTRLFDVLPDGSRQMQAENLIRLPEDGGLGARIQEIAKNVIKETAPTCFQYQQRWLLEALGCCRAMQNKDTSSLGRRHSKKLSLMHGSCPGTSSSWETEEGDNCMKITLM
jgi:hypothetical protein